MINCAFYHRGRGASQATARSCAEDAPLRRRSLAPRAPFGIGCLAMKDTTRSTRTFHLKSLDYATALSFVVYASSATVTPISLVLLSRELAFSLVGGGVVEVMRTTLLVIALAGSGWAAAHWGKALSLGVSAIVLGAGLLAYAAAPTYGVVLLAIALVGFGGGVIEALLNPLVQDLHPDDSGRYLNFLNAFFSFGVMITVLGGGEFLTRGGSWRYIMISLAVLCFLSGVLFLALKGTLSDSRDRSATARARQVLSHKIAVLRHPRFWVFFSMMFLGAGAEGGLNFWSASYIQLHFGELPRIGGIGTGLFALGMIVGRLGSGWLVPQRRLWHLIQFSALTGVVVGLGLPAAGSVTVLLGVLFLSGLTIACFWPSIQSYAVDRTPLDSTALFILLSIGGIPGLGFASWLMGMIGERAGLQASLYVIPAFLALLSILAAMERLRPPPDAGPER
ncbi:MAG: MFS transporter [Spirochaetaceae bacterium]|nr:MAG: MFS transporter [Spirochaetaceae bacterium]